jgi:5-methylcytosine-specific restriction endonuclease McrA
MVRRKRVPSVSNTIFGTPKIRTVKNPLKVGFPSLYPSQPRKDSRRSFSSTQRKQILYQQDNKCARCHKKLDPRATHFHHAKPWSSGGRTKVENGRGLCASCHEILSHGERLKKVDKKRKKREPSLSLF